MDALRKSTATSYFKGNGSLWGKPGKPGNRGNRGETGTGESVPILNLVEWVIFGLPGFTTAASGTEQSGLDALPKATATSYFKGNGSLWVKLAANRARPG